MISAEPFQVIRRREVVNDFGRVDLTTETLDAKGAITPTGDNTLNRGESFQAQPATIRVITIFRLRGESYTDADGSYQPDLVLWKGAHYLVVTTNSYTSYGAGFTDVECSSIDFVDPAE